MDSSMADQEGLPKGGHFSWCRDMFCFISTYRRRVCEVAMQHNPAIGLIN